MGVLTDEYICGRVSQAHMSAPGEVPGLLDTIASLTLTLDSRRNSSFFQAQFFKPASDAAASFYARSGTQSCAHNVSYTCSCWIIDSGAFKRITGSYDLFTSYIPCSGKDKVKV